MEIRPHDELATFAELSRQLLWADPVRHTVAITIVAVRQRLDAPQDLKHLITVHEGGEVRGAALQVAGWPLVVSALPAPFAGAVAGVLAERDPDLAGASGPKAEADAFADAWLARTGRRRHGSMGQRLFALQSLTPPVGVPGAPRVATLDDLELLAAWRADFEAAVIPESWPRAGAEAIARQVRAGHGNILWEVDGEPVAMAGASVPAASMSRIGPVWTPPRHRNRGFGSAVTAAASRWALDAGAEHVVLFTDLSNPVSNAIYPRIGYRAVFDAMEFTFRR
jgi:RimJ/RimL family protein N-acetyltransferase